MALHAKFPLGINYWPRRKAMYMWKHFDAAEIRDEFAHIKALGFDVVRFFLLWEDFQPEPNSVDAQQLRNLVVVMDTARDSGLEAVPTLIVGNMSGALWFPRWAFDGVQRHVADVWVSNGSYVHEGLRDLFADANLLEAQTVIARETAGAIAGHPALHSWDLANELDQVQVPRGDDGARWTARLAGALRSATDTRVTYGAHPPSLTTRGMTIPGIAPSLDYLSIHAYPIYSDITDDPFDTELAPFHVLLTQQLGGKPTQMQEFGYCTAQPGHPSHYIDDEFVGVKKRQFLASEEESADYYRQVLDRLWEVGSYGAMAWCYADYTRDLWDRPPLNTAIRERTFGIVRADGSAKPAADVLRQFGAELHSGAVEQRLGAHGSRAVALDVDPQRYYERPQESYRESYERYRVLLRDVQAKGTTPSIR